MKLRGYAGLIAIVVVGGTAAARPSGVSITTGTPPMPSPAEVTDPSLVGVWRVVKFCRDDPTGRLYDPYLRNGKIRRLVCYLVENEVTIVRPL